MNMTKHKCVANFLIGFGSILNICPIVAVTPTVTTNGQAEANKLIQDSWKQVGESLKQAYRMETQNE